MWIILHADRKTCTQKKHAKLFLLSLHSRCLFSKLQYVYQQPQEMRGNSMFIGSKSVVKNARPLQIVLDWKSMRQSDYFKYLWIYIDHCLAWNKHVTYIQSRVYPKLKLLNRISSFLSRHILLRIDKQTLLLFLEYGCVLAVNAERRMPNA